MPPRSPAMTCRRKRPVAALGLLLLGFLFIAGERAGAADFVDSAGRHVLLSEPIERVMPANPAAEVLVYVLAPGKLAGADRAARRAVGRRAAVLGWRPGMDPVAMAGTARRVGADVIIDAGPVTPERAAYADQVQQLSGIPYILVDDSFARMPSMLRSIGVLLGVTERARHLGRYAEDTINLLRGRLLIQGPETRPRVYYGRQPNGLEAALPASPEGEAIDQAGAINVAGVLGRGGLVAITSALLDRWNPDVIIAERRSFYNALRRGRAWRGLAAVRNKRVYLEPAYPFGWIDDPPGVNRLIGLHWLSGLFYPDENQEDLRSSVCEFYDLFYGIKLTNAQVEAMVRPAGAPPPETTRGTGESIPGLGITPSIPTTPAPSTPTTPPSSAAPSASTTAPPVTAPTTPAVPGADTSTPPPPVAPLSPVTPSAPLPALPPTPSTANATCTLPGANSPLNPTPMTSTSPGTSPLGEAPAGTPGLAPPGRRRGATPGLGNPGALPQ